MRIAAIALLFCVLGHATRAPRNVAAWIEGEDRAAVASAQLRIMETPGTGDFAFASPDDSAFSCTLRASFNSRDPGRRTNPFAIPYGLRI